jgi:hypothetical protein
LTKSTSLHDKVSEENGDRRNVPQYNKGYIRIQGHVAAKHNPSM